VVAWYWESCGIFDICETGASQPFRTFSQLEFTHVFDTMFMLVIGMDIEYDRRGQRAKRPRPHSHWEVKK
jgi:hypothetical protein